MNDDNLIIRLTDDRGRPLLFGDDIAEPECGSVALVNGQYGQAWQRRFDDGRWHCTGGSKSRGKDWGNMLRYRNLVLVYDAAPRPKPHIVVHGAITGRIADRML